MAEPVSDLPLVNVFESDSHRRVAANCVRPKSAAEIADWNLRTPDRAIRGYPGRTKLDDPNLRREDHPYVPEGVQKYLDDLERDGLVKQIDVPPEPPPKKDEKRPADEVWAANQAERAKHLLDRQDADDDVIDFQGLREPFKGRAGRPDAFPQLDSGPHYVMTKLARERLVAPSYLDEDMNVTEEAERVAEHHGWKRAR